MLEFARQKRVPTFVFASSSSVYGVNERLPWREDDNVLLPISPYASTKVSGELLGHAYARLFDIQFVALRFFTVFGPRQRPDLAIHKFARLLQEGEQVCIYGDGSTSRDYTYVDDIVSGIVASMSYNGSYFERINLGNDEPVRLFDVLHQLEQMSGIRARLRFMPEQPGDVPRTWADISKARLCLGYNPQVSLATGLERFWSWFHDRQPAQKAGLNAASHAVSV